MISRYSVTKQDYIHFLTSPLNDSLASSEVSIINIKVCWIIPEYHFYIILFISIQIEIIYVREKGLAKIIKFRTSTGVLSSCHIISIFG